MFQKEHQHWLVSSQKCFATRKLIIEIENSHHLHKINWTSESQQQPKVPPVFSAMMNAAHKSTNQVPNKFPPEVPSLAESLSSAKFNCLKHLSIFQRFFASYLSNFCSSKDNINNNGISSKCNENFVLKQQNPFFVSNNNSSWINKPSALKQLIPRFKTTNFVELFQPNVFYWITSYCLLICIQFKILVKINRTLFAWTMFFSTCCSIILANLKPRMNFWSSSIIHYLICMQFLRKNAPGVGWKTIWQIWHS